jgi:hypothetical protein
MIHCDNLLVHPDYTARIASAAYRSPSFGKGERFARLPHSGGTRKYRRDRRQRIRLRDRLRSVTGRTLEPSMHFDTNFVSELQDMHASPGRSGSRDSLSFTGGGRL